MIAVRVRTRFLALSAACLGLTTFVSGCDNSTVNESGSAGKEGTGASTYKDGGAPPQSQKEYYERLQKENEEKKTAAKKGGAAKKAVEPAKGDETAKP
jgi:hypothetical protein